LGIPDIGCPHRWSTGRRRIGGIGDHHQVQGRSMTMITTEHGLKSPWGIPIERQCNQKSLLPTGSWQRMPLRVITDGLCFEFVAAAAHQAVAGHDPSFDGFHGAARPAGHSWNTTGSWGSGGRPPRTGSSGKSGWAQPSAVHGIFVWGCRIGCRRPGQGTATMRNQMQCQAEGYFIR
jgi:hypothetical protein